VVQKHAVKKFLGEQLAWALAQQGVARRQLPALDKVALSDVPQLGVGAPEAMLSR
jgi:hypothetical protein